MRAQPSPSQRRGGFTRNAPDFGTFSRAWRRMSHDVRISLNRHTNRAYESPAPDPFQTWGSKSTSSYVS